MYEQQTSRVSKLFLGGAETLLELRDYLGYPEEWTPMVVICAVMSDTRIVRNGAGILYFQRESHLWPISLKSQARAKAQSRFTVARETPRVSATSSPVIPMK